MNRRTKIVALALSAIGAGFAIQCGGFSGANDQNPATDSGAQTPGVEGGSGDSGLDDASNDRSLPDADGSSVDPHDDGSVSTDAGGPCNGAPADCTNSICDDAGDILNACGCPTSLIRTVVFQFHDSVNDTYCYQRLPSNAGGVPSYCPSAFTTSAASFYLYPTSFPGSISAYRSGCTANSSTTCAITISATGLGDDYLGDTIPGGCGSQILQSAGYTGSTKYEFDASAETSPAPAFPAWMTAN